MRILICLCILSGCLAAQDSTKTTTPRPAAKTAKQTTKPPVAMAIPKDAVETTPGFYRWKDPAGKADALRGLAMARGIGGYGSGHGGQAKGGGREDHSGGAGRLYPFRGRYAVWETGLGA